MSTMKCIMGYFFITILIPLVIYIASLFNNEQINKFSSIFYFLFAIIIFLYSIRTINRFFSNREHEIIDVGFVIRINIMVFLLFIARYIAVCLLELTEIPEFIVYACIIPSSYFLIFPFIKNYCLNRRTVYVSIILAIIIFYILLPYALLAIEKAIPNKNIYLFNVYNKYFIYESTSNDWTRDIMELLSVQLSDNILLVLLNFSKFVMCCISFLPYLVVDSMLIDELTYRELCRDLPKRKIFACAFVLIICLVACIEMVDIGEMELIYYIKH